MNVYNYVSLNLYSLIGYSNILLYALIRWNFDFAKYDIPAENVFLVHEFIHFIGILCLFVFVIEFLLYKKYKKIKIVEYKNIILKMFFWLGFILTTSSIIFYLTFFTMYIKHII